TSASRRPACCSVWCRDHPWRCCPRRRQRFPVPPAVPSTTSAALAALPVAPALPSATARSATTGPCPPTRRCISPSAAPLKTMAGLTAFVPPFGNPPPPPPPTLTNPPPPPQLRPASARGS